MLDIKRLLVKLSTTDAQLRTLLGATTQDPRIYEYYQPDALVDDKHRAYITYANTVYPEHTNAQGEPVYSLAVWGLNLQSVDPVRERLVALLDDDTRRRDGTYTPLTTETGRRVRVNRLNDRDSYQENTKFTGVNLQFRVSFSRV